jgi:hypothetical protein
MPPARSVYLILPASGILRSLGNPVLVVHRSQEVDKYNTICLQISATNLYFASVDRESDS